MIPSKIWDFVQYPYLRGGVIPLHAIGKRVGIEQILVLGQEAINMTE